ncbi:MAG: hypothetical protein GXO28_02970 [Methanopyri archaeon]|nr:hypothetical protein [Methanopyri archaeon]
MRDVEEIVKASREAAGDVDLGVAVLEERLLTTALHDVAGDRARAMLFQAGRLAARRVAEWSGEDTMEGLLESLSKVVGLEFEVKEDRVVVEGCPECVGFLGARDPVCHFTRGVISKAYEMETGERVPVSEVSCRAVGDAECVFVIGEKGTPRSPTLDGQTMDDFKDTVDLPSDVKPEHVLAFRALQRSTLADVVGRGFRALMFDAGRRYGRVLREEAGGGPMEDVLAVLEEELGIVVDVDGNVLRVENCPFCASLTMGPVCDPFRGALYELCREENVEIREIRCAGAEGEPVGTCEFELRRP